MDRTPIETLRATARDHNWSEPTKTAITNILAADPSASLSSIFVELLCDRSSRVRRDALEGIGCVGLDFLLQRQLTVLAEGDPDPLCQARARLILAEPAAAAPRQLPDVTDGDISSSIGRRRVDAAMARRRERPSSSETITNEIGRVNVADFQYDSPFRPSVTLASGQRELLFESLTPPSPAPPFPDEETSDAADTESSPDNSSVPRLLDRPLSGPDAIFDTAAASYPWPVHPLEAPLGYTGRSGILPTDIQEDGHFVPMPDRWRSGFPNWDRYGRDHPPGEDYPYKKGHWWDPYNLNVLKGDYPVIGQHTFLKFTGQINSLQEYRQLPSPTTPFESTVHENQPQFFGDPNEYFTTNYFKLSVELTHGNTSFKPVDLSVRLTPIFNYNYLDTQDLGLVNPDVRKGTTRRDDFLALEEYFVEAKLKDLSADYDFVSVRAGSQPFNSDFRGFIFSDTNRAIRLFGTRLANRDQFNLAFFRQAEKDTNSQLNTFQDRNQSILIANYYRQDFLFPGYTAQLSMHYNNDGPSFKFDRNNFLARPDPVGVFQPHRVQSVYLGMAGDGHIGRVNVTNAFYWVTGRDSQNPIAGTSQRINAKMAAGEISYDRDWIRFRASAFYASGDNHACDGTATGFDSILDSPNFAGGPFSFWQRQQINLQGVGLVNRFSLVPDLRSSKFEGQSNFVNPGLRLLNLGVDFELTPKTRLITNANYLQFDSLGALQYFTFQNHIRRDIGVDLSVGLEYRPALNDNIILTGGYACLVPGGGFRDLYGTTKPFTTANAGSGAIGVLNSVFAQCILQF